MAIGQSSDAIAAFRQVVRLQPAPANLHSNLLYALNFDAAYDPPTIFAEHLAWAQRHAEPLTALALRHANDRTPGRRLRIGYVSEHFRFHAVNFFVEPMLASHDHEQFEIFCYSEVRNDDAVTVRLKALADCWRNVRQMSDDQIAQQVRDDRIDVLVDLAGHIAGNRLLVFARKPAPVQVTYLGYQNTTGMSAMDYRLTDAAADPPGRTDAFYTERLIRLPRSFFCYRPPDASPPITALPALTTGHVTFGSFNNFSKVSQHVLITWLRILHRLARSRLLVLAECAAHVRQQVHDLARTQGIEPSRIEVFDHRPNDQYLRLLQQADIALDPFPFTGHTTTCDSVWMGLPVVMLEGDRYASRFGGSVLANVGLDRLIASSVEQYSDLAVGLASDLERLAQLRSELRPRMSASPLLDFQGFTRNLEHAYRQMWLTWVASAKSEQFTAD
jgi:predicted O-linked N-acetylglucosamine transferase (SPINDLY family)